MQTLTSHAEPEKDRPMIHGVDLSQWNVVRSYPELASAIGFGYAKCTDALKRDGRWIPFVDAKHDEHSLGLRACGKPTGSYAFGHPTQDVAACAAFFVQHAYFDQLRPVLDLESLNPDKTVPTNAGTWAAQWLAIVERDSGTKPIVYSGKYYAEEMLRQVPALAAADWWIAAYGSGTTAPDHMPAVVGLLPGRVLAFQWSGSARLPGIDGDADRDLAPSLEPLYVERPLDAGHEMAGA